MKTNRILLLTIVLAFSGATAMAGQYQSVPGGGTPAVGGKGPGMGHDYRQNMGGPGIGRGAMPAAQRPAAPSPPAPPQRPARPQAPEMPQGQGYRGYPNWNPGTAVPYGNPQQRYGRPGRQGYGYPGYRGRGGEGYPGHRQYGAPPGVPSAPPAGR